MDKSVALADIRIVFERAKEELERLLAAKPDHWLTAYAADLTPFRSNGNEIRLFGGEIWTSPDRWEAQATAQRLQRKAQEVDSKSTISAFSVQAYVPLRHAMLDKLLAALPK